MTSNTIILGASAVVSAGPTPVNVTGSNGTSGQVITMNGDNLTASWGTPSSSATPTGNAGGALSGTYPNPTISLTSNSSITGQLPSANQAPQTLGGDLSGTTAAAVVAKIDGYTMPSPATAGVLVSSGTVLSFSTVAVSSITAGTANQILINSATPTPAWTTLSQDVTNVLGVMTVNSISGSSPLAITPATLQWLTGTTSPTIKQADNTTNSATAQNLTIQAQNATGTTANGGALNLCSGSGTTSSGTINIQYGGTTIAGFTNTNLSFNDTGNNIQIQLNSRGSNSTTKTLSIRGQNANASATGSATVGGALTFNSGAGIANGTATIAEQAGLLSLQAGGNTIVSIDGYGLHIAQSSLIALATGTNTLTTANFLTPYVRFNGTPGAGTCTIAIGGISSNQLIFMDFSQVTLGATAYIITNGAGSVTVTTLLGTKTLLTVATPTTSTIAVG